MSQKLALHQVRGEGRSSFSTGLFDGGIVTVNSGDDTQVDISAGYGIVADFTNPEEPQITKVAWDAQTGITAINIAGGTSSFIGVDASGTFVQQLTPFTEAQLRSIISLAKIVHVTTFIDAIVPAPIAQQNSALRTVDLAAIFGNICIEGNVYGANGANLKLNKSAGRTFRLGSNYENDVANPDITTDPETTQLSFDYIRQNGTGGWSQDFAQTDINPNKYDDGSGTLADVTAGYWVVQRVYQFNSNNSQKIHHSQGEYMSYSAALESINSDDFNEFSSLRDAVLRAFIIVKQGTTELNDTDNCRFIEANPILANKYKGVAVGYETDPLITPAEVTAGTATTPRRFTPANIVAMILAHALGGGGSSVNKARITRWMRVYCYTDTRWISLADDNYGMNTENASEGAGTGVNPIVEWENRGEPFKKGDIIKNIEIRSRANNTQVTDLEVYIMYVHPNPITRWDTGLDDDSELTTIDLYRNNWKTTAGDTENLPSTVPINDIIRRKYTLDYTVPEDGDLRIFFKPAGTLTATRYFYPAVTIDYELE